MAQHITLASGQKMGLAGFGTWQAKVNEVGDAVRVALDTGYRHIDCAMAYQNEEEIGRSLAPFVSTSRGELFITSKLWNTFHNPEDVQTACQKTVRDLGVDCLDLYLMHWPMAFKNDDHNTTVLFPKDESGAMLYANHPIEETYKAMENLVDLGLTKAIGLSNFNSEQIARILKIARIKPVVNQVEVHVFLQQHKLQEYCESHGIKLVAYSPLGNGAAEFFTEPTIVEIAKQHNKTPAQVMLRFLVQRGIPVLPKSVNPSRIRENFDLFSFTLTDDNVKSIVALDKGHRIIVPRIVVNGESVIRDAVHPEFPFHIAF